MSVLANAVLTAIYAPGSPDEYGDTTDGSVLWAGRASGYLKRSRRSVVSGGRELQIRRDVFTILATAGAPVLTVAGPDWEATTVTIEDQRVSPPVTRRFTVVAMEDRAAGTIVDSVRLELDREQTT